MCAEVPRISTKSYRILLWHRRVPSRPFGSYRFPRAYRNALAKDRESRSRRRMDQQRVALHSCERTRSGGRRATGAAPRSSCCIHEGVLAVSAGRRRAPRWPSSARARITRSLAYTISRVRPCDISLPVSIEIAIRSGRPMGRTSIRPCARANADRGLWADANGDAMVALGRGSDYRCRPRDLDRVAWRRQRVP